MSYIKIFFSAALSTFIFCSSATAELSTEELASKNKGIELYNQHKAISAVSYLEIAASAGDHEAQYYLGEALRRNKRYMTPEAQSAYEASALQGDIYAMIRLSEDSSDLCVAMGNCPEGRKEPKEWLEIAKKTASAQAEKGNAESMYLMFRITGNDEWLEKSAKGGYAFAQYYLGTGYKGGKGFFVLPSSRADVVEHLMKSSAEGGYPVGMMEYAAICAEKKDFDKYRYWSKKAAETGYAGAVFGYGINLSKPSSEYGFSYDPVTSYALMTLLLELDGGGGMKDYAGYELPSISAKMSSEQIEKAKTFSKEWKDNHPPLSFFPDKLSR